MNFSFFKKNDQEIIEVKSLIEDLQILVRQNSDAIIDVDDKLQVFHNNHSHIIQNHEDDLHKLKDSDISERVEELSKMQKLITTWIIVLCTTSIFSFLLYFKII